MNANTTLQSSARRLGWITSTLACALAAQAAAQPTLDLPSLTIPAESQKSANDIRVTKTATADGFEITVANHGAEKVTGIVVSERASNISACPAASAVTITGSNQPQGRFTIADLTGAGIMLGALSGDQLVTFTYSCGVK